MKYNLSFFVFIVPAVFFYYFMSYDVTTREYRIVRNSFLVGGRVFVAVSKIAYHYSDPKNNPIKHEYLERNK